MDESYSSIAEVCMEVWGWSFMLPPLLIFHISTSSKSFSGNHWGMLYICNLISSICITYLNSAIVKPVWHKCKRFVFWITCGFVGNCWMNWLLNKSLASRAVSSTDHMQGCISVFDYKCNQPNRKCYEKWDFFIAFIIRCCWSETIFEDILQYT